MTAKETEIVMPKDIIEYIDSKLIGNVVPLNIERDAIFMIENYANQKITQKQNDINELVKALNEVYRGVYKNTKILSLIQKHTKI